jgi:hypothetical protein
MPLRIPEPPEQLSDVIVSRLHAVAATPERRLRSLRGAEPATPTPMSPIPIYVLGLSDLLSADALSKARLSGWRFLLQDSLAQTVSCADTIELDGQQRFAQFTTGPFVASIPHAITRAEELTQDQAEDAELRLLSVPALHLTATWVHTNQSDLLAPLAPTPAGLREDTSYTPPDLIDAVRTLAQAKLSINPQDGTVG